MRRSTFISLAFVCAVASVQAADSLPRVSLALLPATTLPGLPVGFLLTIANPSSSPIVIVDLAKLLVTTTSGTFNALSLRFSTTTNLPSDQIEKCNDGHCLTVPAGGQRDIYLRFGPGLDENEFFADHRLSFPGRYDLEVILSVLNLPSPDMTEIHSDSQTLVVHQPTGADLAVWNLLQQTSGGKGWSVENWIDAGEGVARQIRATYPSSSYVAWVAAIGPVTRTSFATKLAQLDSALAANPPAPVHDELLLAKGGLLMGWSQYAVFNERDADKAVALSDQAGEVFNLLRDAGLTDYTRKQAAGQLAHLLTRATALDDLRFYAASDTPAPAAVVPRVECVTKGAGQSFTARFGYSNPNRVIKVLQIGPDNQVTPAPRQQGQPLVFKPGDHASVFVASSPGGELKWHLDGSAATATAGFPTQCTP